MVGFVLLRGFVSLLPDGPPRDQPAQAAAPTQEPQDPGAASFAALFAREYLTYRPSDTGERIARLQPFLAPGIDRLGGLDTTRATQPQTVTQAWPWKVTTEGDASWSVVVVAQLLDAPEGKAPRYVALSVPVAADKAGAFGVTAYPVFVPIPLDKPGADLSRQEPGEPVSDADPAVRDLLVGFLKAYTGGTPAEIRYYLLPGATLPGLNGQFTFQELTGLQVRKEGDRLWAVADARLADPVTGSEYRQHLVFELAKQERWYIKDMLQKGETAR